MERIKIAYVFRTYLKGVSFNHFFRSVQQTSLLIVFNFVFLINVFKFSLFTTKQIFQLRKIFIEILRGNHFNKIEYFSCFYLSEFSNLLEIFCFIASSKRRTIYKLYTKKWHCFWIAFKHQSVHHSKEH